MGVQVPLSAPFSITSEALANAAALVVSCTLRLLGYFRVSILNHFQNGPTIPACLPECPIWWAIWDLSLVIQCPIQGRLLTGPLPLIRIEAADQHLPAPNEGIYRAASFPPATRLILFVGSIHHWIRPPCTYTQLSPIRGLVITSC